MKFFVAKYDVVGFQENKPYSDLSNAAPEFVATCDTKEEADKIADGMSKSNGGETIDVTLRNGKQYSGPRYIYRTCEQEM